MLLECSPGTICVGINAMVTCSGPNAFYARGMMVSDLCFPTEISECFGRMQKNMEFLHQSGLGFSFFDGMDASCARWKLTNYYGLSNDKLDERIGLVLCEEIWPWDRRQWPIVADFHTSIARSLMCQWGNATCVMVLRSSDAQQLQRSLGTVRRISYHYGSKFNIHYMPLCMDGADPPKPITGQEWCAIVIHPKRFDRRLAACTGNVFIPELVLKAMFSRRCTLQLCAYIGESAMSVMRFLKNIKQLHNV